MNSAQKRLGLRKFIFRIPTHYPPTMAQQNYFLLVQWGFKVFGLHWLINGLPAHISQRFQQFAKDGRIICASWDCSGEHVCLTHV